MFSGVGGATASRPVADDPAAGLRDVPAEVRDHHAGADHRLVRRAGAVLGLPAVHGACSASSSTAPLAHWTWHPDGFLHKWGVLDFAGGTVVHMSAGFAALAGAMVLGRRKTHMPRRGARRRPTSRSCCSAPACSGSAGSASTPARRSRRQRHGGDRLRDDQHGVGRGDARLDLLRLDARQQALGARRLHRRRRRPGGDHAGGRLRHRRARASSSAWSPASSATWPCTGTKSTLDDTLDVFPCHGVGGMIGMTADRRLRQGRRPDLGPDDDVPAITCWPW